MLRVLVRSHPLVWLATGPYYLYCLVGLLSLAIGSGESVGVRGFLFLVRLWPYPMLRSMGWRVDAESVIVWVAADGAGLVLIAGLAWLFERILGPERRLTPGALMATLIGVPVVLILVQVGVALAFRTR